MRETILLEKGIDLGYVTWFYHKERISSKNSRNKSCDECGNVGNDEYAENMSDEDDSITKLLFEFSEKYLQFETIICILMSIMIE